MPAPSKYPDWATDGANTVEPPAGKVAAGWLPAEQPPAGWFNWWQGVVGQWTRWLDGAVTSLTGRVGTLETEMDAVEAINGSQGAALAGLADAAHKNQENTFSLPQTITANIPGRDALTVTGHIVSTAGSIGAWGVGSNVEAQSDVRAGNLFVYLPTAERVTPIPLASAYNIPMKVFEGHLVVGASDILTWPLKLPAGAILHSVSLMLNKSGTATDSEMTIVKKTPNWGSPGTVLGARVGDGLKRAGAAAGWQVVSIDCRNATILTACEYEVTFNGSADGTDQVHALAASWTDPGPRNH